MKNTFVKVLSFVMALMMVVGTFGTLAVFAETCTHENKELTDHEDPTCISIGYDEYKCKDCGKTLYENVVPALGEDGHKFTVKVDSTNADCEKPGYAAHVKCSICGTAQGGEPAVIEPAKGHQYFKDVYVAADCENAGYRTKACVLCGDEDEKEKALGGNYEVINALGHDYKYESVEGREAVCFAGAYKVTCTRCDYNETIVDNDVEEHQLATATTTITLNDVEYKIGAGCGFKYKEVKYCTVCQTVIETKENDDLGHKDYTDVAYNGEGKLPDTAANAKLEEFGYAAGDVVYVAPKCGVPGFVVAKCNDCGEYFERELEVETTNDDTIHLWGDEVKTDKVTELPCVDSYQYVECENCDAILKIESSIREATEKHDLKVVNSATCTANGYVVTSCKVCGTETSKVLEYALGHDFTEWAYATGETCATATVLVRSCKRANCPGADPDELQKADGRTECGDFTTKFVKATCVSNAENHKVCGHCKYDYGTTGVEQPATGFDKNNHLISAVEGYDYSGFTFLQNTRSADCADGAYADYSCACGKVFNVKVSDKNDHVYVKGLDEDTQTVNANAVYDSNRDGDLNDAGDKDWRPVASTCKTLGWAAGEGCVNCGDEKKARARLTELDPTNHENTDVSAVRRLDALANVDATCSAPECEWYWYPCCGNVAVPVEDGEIDANNHAAATRVGEYVANGCLTNGKKAYFYCADCEKYMLANNDGSGNTYDASRVFASADALDLVIPKLSTTGDHKWDTVNAEIAEQCTVDGVKAHKICSFCRGYLIDGQTEVKYDDPTTTDVNEITALLKIPAHGNKNLNNVYYLYKDAAVTCTDGAYVGVPNQILCTKCGTNGADGVSFHGEFWQDARHLGLSEDPLYVSDHATMGCTVPSYDVYGCTVCGEQWVENYDATGVKEHVFKYTDGENAGKYKNPVGDPVAPTCETRGYTVYKCDNCNETVKDDWKDIVSHSYMVSEGVYMDISFDCDKYETYKGLTCRFCSKTVRPLTAEEKAAHANEILNHVGLIDDEVDATCTTPGHHIVKCACGLYAYEDSQYKAPLNHKNKVAVDGEPGFQTYYCPDCEETLEIPVTYIESAIAADNLAVAVGTAVEVTVKVSAKALTFGQLFFDVNLGDAFALDAVELVATFENANAHADLYKNVAEGIDGFVIYTENTAAGEPVFVTLDGDEIALVTLTLVATKKASANVQVSATKAVTGFNEDGEEISATLVDNGVAATLTATNVGDLNADGKVGVSDIQAMIPQITLAIAQGDNKNANLDVNKDGVVDQFDVAALRLFMKKGFTAAAYLEMIGEDLAATLDSYRYESLSQELNVKKTINDQFATMTYTAYLNNVASNGGTLVSYVNTLVSGLVAPAP